MAVSTSQQFLEGLWYRPTPWWLWLFLPFQLLLLLVVWARRTLYRIGVFKSHQISKPVVVIGNISVGGTGKTPLSIYLLQWLESQGYKAGLVTRGYGGHSPQYPLQVTDSTQASECGDEPYLIYQRCKSSIVVDPQRSRGAQRLVELGCDIILCDDGLQHYALERDLEIGVVDHARGYGNGWLMPMGPLREPKSRMSSVDIKVSNGYDMRLVPEAIKGLNHDKDLTATVVDAVAAIGNPKRFFGTLESIGLEAIPHEFPDHHRFSIDDFKDFSGPIVMTEKDAVKCYGFADERMYYLPVKTTLTPELAGKLHGKILSLL